MNPYTITGLSGIAAMTLAGCTGNSDARLKKPNIVFIFADDLGYNDLGCYGQKIFETRDLA